MKAEIEDVGDLHIPADVHRRLIDWYQRGDVGISSEAIVAVMVGSPMFGSRYGRDTPSDPSDLNRCIKLLERFPEWRERLPEMAATSKRWGRLAACWDLLVQSWHAEAAQGPNAPITWVGMCAANYGPENGMRLAARMGFDLLAATTMVEAVEAATVRR